MEEIQEYLGQIQAIQGILETLEENSEEKVEYEQMKRDLEELVELIRGDEPTTSDQNPPGPENNADFNDLLGSRCMVPYSADRSLRVHSAIIMDIEAGKDVDSTWVRVLFSHPICPAMRPCQHFLSENCRFLENCRFSHGYRVLLSEVEEYEEPNFEHLKEHTVILAKCQDLWELGRIKAMDETDFAVEMMKNGKNQRISRENVMAIRWEEEKKVEKVEKMDIRSGNGSDIAMKMMLKMGYQAGKGLGKRNDGIVEAIQARICPKNASLDEIMNRKRKSNDTPNNTLQKKKKAAKIPEEIDIFTFINNRITKPAKLPEKIQEMSKKSLGRHTVDLDIEVKKLETKRKKLKEGIQRNSSDRSTVSRLDLQLKEVEAEIVKIEKNQMKVNSEISSRQGKKKEKDIF